DGRVRIADVSIESVDHGPLIRPTSRVRITLRYRSSAGLHRPRFLIGIYDYSNTGIYALDSEAAAGIDGELPPEGCVTVLTDAINLTPGSCYLNVAVMLD